MAVKSALILLDLQEAMFNDPMHPVFLEEQLISNINVLREKAYEAHVPVIYFKHTINACSPMAQGNQGWEIHAPLAPKEDDIIMRKYTPNAYHETELLDYLSNNEIKRVYIAGLQTEFCIDTTVRAGLYHGIDQVLIEDAHSTYDSDVIDAEEIINHHNETLPHWFCTLKRTKQVQF